MISAHPPVKRVRGFQLCVQLSGPDDYGLLLEQTNGSAATAPLRVTRADPAHTRRLMASVLRAVKASGHAKTVMSAMQAKPVPITEEEGVRLALLFIASAPVTKTRRIEEMVSVVASLSTEEAYYWYAKCTGPDASRIRRAFRLFLAGE